MAGLDEARADRVAADAAVAELGVDRAGELQDRALGDAVGDFRRKTAFAADRRGADDRALAGRQHVRQHRLGHQEHALDVDVHLLVPVGFRGLQERFHDQDAGMIEQGVDRAKGVRVRSNCCLDRGSIGDVALDGDGRCRQHRGCAGRSSRRRRRRYPSPRPWHPRPRTARPQPAPCHRRRQ